MAWFKKQNKVDPSIPETLSLTAENIVESTTDRQEKTLEKVSSDLQNRLRKELNGILSEVVDTAIDRTHAETEQLLRNELLTMLEARLDQLVEQAIKTHLTKPRQQ